MWKALKNIALRERCTIHDLCSLISLRKNPNTSLTAAIRVFLMLYFKAAATEEGHKKAGHGDFDNMKRRAGMAPNWTAVTYLKVKEQQDEAITARLKAHLAESVEEVKHAMGSQK
jgi:hypothetical protein